MKRSKIKKLKFQKKNHRFELATMSLFIVRRQKQHYYPHYRLPLLLPRDSSGYAGFGSLCTATKHSARNAGFGSAASVRSAV